jgi:universal stress protein F
MFNQILIPIDLAHQERFARIMEAARLLIDGAGSVTLLSVAPILAHKAGSPELEESYPEHESEARAQLQRLSKSLELENVELKVMVREGVVHDQILEHAAEISADAILMVARQPGLSSYFIGSAAERVVRHADCSVFVIRQ